MYKEKILLMFDSRSYDSSHANRNIQGKWEHIFLVGLVSSIFRLPPMGIHCHLDVQLDGEEWRHILKKRSYSNWKMCEQTVFGKVDGR